VTRVRTEVLVGLIVLGNLTLGPAATAAPASAQCGAPDDAPGFETPAQRRVVPDVGCMDLQLAQDKAQAAGYRVVTEDASGQRRRQVDDRGWVVVSQTPAAGTRPKGSPRVALQVLAYGDPGAPPSPDRTRPGRMPNLQCFDLQEGQDTLESAGFFNMASEDATGRRRRQYIDRNWTVTDQAPRPGGTHPKNTRVTLRVVKDREPSPC
jgi:hypothetical protein